MSRNGDGGGRWDTERFLRERDNREERSSRRTRGRSVVVAERERDPVDRKRLSFVEDLLRREEEYPVPARRSDREYDDAHLIGSSEALIPYEERRRRSPSPARSPARAPRRSSSRAPRPETRATDQSPPRPTLLRRQSSLDTFDRAANRRAHDYYRYDREDYGPPVIPVAPRRRAASRVRVPDHDPEMDEISVAEPDYYGDERFRRMRERERSSTPRGRQSTLREQVAHERIESRPFPHRGKTRIPKRFVHPRAMIDLGYPYEDEGETYLILKALSKENIDELLALSHSLFVRAEVPAEERETERVIVGTKNSDLAVERRRSRSRSVQRVSLAVPAERRRVYSPSPTRSPAPRRVVTRPRRRSSPIPVRQVVDDVIEPRADMALILPDRTRHRDESPRGEVVEVRRAPKGPTPRMIRAMLAALT
ncbi:hypothetical protein VTO42DRAFT_1341 [Malbranchea cinnamomea]